MTGPSTQEGLRPPLACPAMSSYRSISPWDDFPVHQTSEYVRHPATSDRNFYDRYYFNLHPSSGEYFAIFGLGQYPNLGTTDAYLAVTRGDDHLVVRASKPLIDRSDISVGPVRIEVIEPLRRLRAIVEPERPADSRLAMDVTWTSPIDPFEEPRQYLRARGTVMFNTQRFAQLGRWEGTLTVDGTDIAVTPDVCGGARDRSWGVRPVGEKQPDGIRQTISTLAGMWNYMPADYGDHWVVYLCHEEPDGNRTMQTGMRIWTDPDRPREFLGRPEWTHDTISGTRLLAGSHIAFPDAPGGPITVDVEPLATNFISVGAGYGVEPDWRHGMWQGEGLQEQARSYTVSEIRGLGQYGVVDSVARFSYNDPARGPQAGFGLYEHGFFGPFPKLGLTDRGDLFR